MIILILLLPLVSNAHVIVRSVESGISRHTSKLEELDGRVNGLALRASAYETDLSNNIKSINESITSTTTSTKNSINQIKGSIAEMNTSISNFESKTNISVNGLVAAVDSITSDNNSNTKSISSQERQV